jgi:hypothetical protein
VQQEYTSWTASVTFARGRSSEVCGLHGGLGGTHTDRERAEQRPSASQRGKRALPVVELDERDLRLVLAGKPGDADAGDRACSFQDKALSTPREQAWE